MSRKLSSIYGQSSSGKTLSPVDDLFALRLFHVRCFCLFFKSSILPLSTHAVLATVDSFFLLSYNVNDFEIARYYIKFTSESAFHMLIVNINLL